LFFVYSALYQIIWSNFRIELEASQNGLLHMLENTFDQKRIYANPSFNPSSNPSSNPKSNPEAQCFRTDEMMSFFEQVYRYPRKMVLFDNSSPFV